MKTTFLLFCVFLLEVTVSNAKHHVHWNPDVFQKISERNILYHEVKLDELMDITCSKHHLAKTNFMKFVIYNVSKEVFHSCSKINKDAEKILSCNQFRQEKKITFKFQKFSPNPRGFIFYPEESYYLMAYANDNETKIAQANCKDKTRMEIKVLPKNYNKSLKKTELFTIVKRKLQRSLDSTSHIMISTNKKIMAHYAALHRGPENAGNAESNSNKTSTNCNLLLMSLSIAFLTLFSGT